MRLMTCIEDLRRTAHRKVPRAFIDYAEAGSYARTDAARQPRRSRAHQAAPARPVRCQQAQHRDDDPRRACRAAASAGADRALRHAARRRRDIGLPRGAGGGHSVHAVDDVDLFDRGCRRGRRQAVLVSALRHEGPRLYPRADRACGGGQMQRARPHRRSPGHRPAAQRHQERHDRAAGDPLEERDRHRHQAGLGAQRPARQAQDLRQYRRPLSRHGQRHRAVEMDLRTIRRDAELERRRVDQEHLAGQADPQGHSRCRGCAHRRKDRRRAIVVSNHGGRQLDGASSSISMLPPIAEARRLRD